MVAQLADLGPLARAPLGPARAQRWGLLGRRPRARACAAAERARLHLHHQRVRKVQRCPRDPEGPREGHPRAVEHVPARVRGPHDEIERSDGARRDRDASALPPRVTKTRREREARGAEHELFVGGIAQRDAERDGLIGPTNSARRQRHPPGELQPLTAHTSRQRDGEHPRERDPREGRAARERHGRDASEEPPEREPDGADEGHSSGVAQRGQRVVPLTASPRRARSRRRACAGRASRRRGGTEPSRGPLRAGLRARSLRSRPRRSR